MRQKPLMFVVRRAADRASTHSAGKADAERARGKLPRTDAGRVFGSELVSESVRCAAEDLGMTEGVQRGATTQQLGIPNPEGVCRKGGSALLTSLKPERSQGHLMPRLFLPKPCFVGLSLTFGPLVGLYLGTGKGSKCQSKHMIDRWSPQPA
jgi:hypothetical protein